MGLLYLFFTLWITLFGRSRGYVARQDTKGTTDLQNSSKNDEASGNTTRRRFTESTVVDYHLP